MKSFCHGCSSRPLVGDGPSGLGMEPEPLEPPRPQQRRKRQPGPSAAGGIFSYVKDFMAMTPDLARERIVSAILEKGLRVWSWFSGWEPGAHVGQFLHFACLQALHKSQIKVGIGSFRLSLLTPYASQFIFSRNIQIQIGGKVVQYSIQIERLASTTP